jgi:hypothetical protein
MHRDLLYPELSVDVLQGQVVVVSAEGGFIIVAEVLEIYLDHFGDGSLLISILSSLLTDADVMVLVRAMHRPANLGVKLGLYLRR